MSVEMTIEEAAERIGVTPVCLRERIKAGYYPEWAKAVRPNGSKIYRFVIVRAKFNAYFGVED